MGRGFFVGRPSVDSAETGPGRSTASQPMFPSNSPCPLVHRRQPLPIRPLNTAITHSSIEDVPKAGARPASQPGSRSVPANRSAATGEQAGTCDAASSSRVARCSTAAAHRLTLRPRTVSGARRCVCATGECTSCAARGRGWGRVAAAPHESCC